MSVIDVTPDVTIKIEIGGGSVDTEKLSTATNLLNGEAEGSLRSVGSSKESDSYKLGRDAVAVGLSTKASGDASFAEGAGTIASGLNSHAEGYLSVASAAHSHAEGYGTSAGSESQHAQGKHNIYDTKGKYAHIVGNGADANNPSNAHTLDWNGNAWFAGDVIVGGTGQDDPEAKVLATQEYVTKKISEIDIPSLDGYATEQYVDDKIAGIKFPDESDALDLLAELGFVEPIAADDGTVYTDDNNVVYVQ